MHNFSDVSLITLSLTAEYANDFPGLVERSRYNR